MSHENSACTFTLSSVCSLPSALCPLATRSPPPSSQQPSLLPHHTALHSTLRYCRPSSLSPPHLSPLSALIPPTLLRNGEGAAHHTGGHSAGVHHGGSPAGQAKHAGALRQLLPHPHLPAAHLHHCLANVSGRGHSFPCSQ